MQRPPLRRIVILTALLVGAFASMPGLAQTTLRYSDHESLGNMRTSVIRAFLDDVEKRSAGRLRLDLHWGGDIASGYNALAT